MTSDIEVAAYLLLQSIDAPRGFVSALAWADQPHSRIRLFIDPAVKSIMTSMPCEFAGFPVEVELRGPGIALTNPEPDLNL
jgi:hypothetical protein